MRIRRSLSGYNPDVGRQLVGMLEAAGLESVGATGRSVLLRGGSPEVQLYKYELETAGAQMVLPSTKQQIAGAHLA